MEEASKLRDRMRVSAFNFVHCLNKLELVKGTYATNSDGISQLVGTDEAVFIVVKIWKDMDAEFND